jgi:hypothetical protein
MPSSSGIQQTDWSGSTRLRFGTSRLTVAVAVVIVFLVTVHAGGHRITSRRRCQRKVMGQKNEVIALQVKMGELTRHITEDPVARQQVPSRRVEEQIERLTVKLAQWKAPRPEWKPLSCEMSPQPGVSPRVESRRFP